ncbi:SMI1/KNR4 family protein [Rariglobus hedericola]
MRDQSYNLPVILYEDEGTTIFRTSSYARSPGGDTVAQIEALLQNRLPDDFRAFYASYAEALAVTRSYPIHFWDIEKIKEWFADMRYSKPYPLRFIRFGEYWDLGSTQFALWQKNPDKPDWMVVTTSVGQHDDQYDDPNFTDYYKLGDSFSGWLEDWIARDGLPDPFMKLGPEGGFLDPVDASRKP